MRIVFVGPSAYPSARLRRMAGDGIVWRGPAQQGDIARAVQDGATAVGLVDGLYGTVAAVWHKEILHALECGVAVIGGASLGALRAVECAAFGMLGVGAIFGRYRAGDLVDDGDVALLHAPAEMDFAPLTEALVDVEATIGRLEGSRLCDPQDARALHAAARRLFFWDRTFEAVAGTASLDRPARDRLEHLMTVHRVSAKRHDAIAVLRALASAEAPTKARNWATAATRAQRSLADAATARETQALHIPAR